MVNERDGEKVKAKKAKWIRKCIHMFDLRPVKMWEFNKCMYPWGITLLSTLCFSFLIIPISNFPLILKPSIGLKIDLYFRCLISAYSSSDFPSYKVSDIRMILLISQVQCL